MSAQLSGHVFRPPARRKILLNRFAIKALTMRILRNRRQSRIAAKKWETTDYADEQAAS
jgi:hypothetical protein